MNKPKYLQALDLREQGLSYQQIAVALKVKVRQVCPTVIEKDGLERLKERNKNNGN